MTPSPHATAERMRIEREMVERCAQIVARLAESQAEYARGHRDRASRKRAIDRKEMLACAARCDHAEFMLKRAIDEIRWTRSAIRIRAPKKPKGKNPKGTK